MKKIDLILIGVDLNLDETIGEESKPKEEKITLETSLEYEDEIPDPLKNQPEKKERAMVEIPATLLEKLLNTIKGNSGEDSKALANEFRRLSEELQAGRNGEERFVGIRPVSIEDIDKDDILEVPEVYFAHSVSYTLWDDMKNGRTVKAPFGRPVKFKLVFRTVDKSIPRSPKYINFSAAIIWSKKISQFLDSHSLLGIKFFKKSNEGRDISALMAEKLSMHFSSINNLTEQEVIRACSSENIKINTPDVAELRRRLAIKRAKSSMDNDASITREAAKQMGDLLNTMGFGQGTIVKPKEQEAPPIGGGGIY